MERLREFIERQEAQVFVDRDAEFARFQQWLTSGNTELLNVYGPPGIGKTAFLRTCLRDAAARGYLVRMVDGRFTEATPHAVIKALGTPKNVAALARRSRASALLVLDSFDQIQSVSHYLLQEFFPALESTVRVVVASRGCLLSTWAPVTSWIELVQPLQLSAISDAQARVYMHRRGLDEPVLADATLTASGGHPMALSLATSLALHHRNTEFATSPEWRVIVHALVEYFLADVASNEARELARTCALTEIDADANLTGDSQPTRVADMLDQLCRQSLIGVADDGLALQEDVRRFFVADLDWFTGAGVGKRTRRRVEAPTQMPTVSAVLSPSRRAAQHTLRNVTLADDPTEDPNSGSTLLYPVPPRNAWHGAVSIHTTTSYGDSLGGLTPREREVALLLSSGRTTNRELAAALVISEGTANLHVKHILSKLGLARRAQLPAWLLCGASDLAPRE